MTLHLEAITLDDLALEGLRIRYNKEKDALIYLIKANEEAGRDAGQQLFSRLASQRRVVNTLGVKLEAAIHEANARR
jgi:hypothetical protein